MKADLLNQIRRALDAHPALQDHLHRRPSATGFPAAILSLHPDDAATIGLRSVEALRRSYPGLSISIDPSTERGSFRLDAGRGGIHT